MIQPLNTGIVPPWLQPIDIEPLPTAYIPDPWHPPRELVHSQHGESGDQTHATDHVAHSGSRRVVHEASR